MAMSCHTSSPGSPASTGCVGIVGGGGGGCVGGVWEEGGYGGGVIGCVGAGAMVIYAVATGEGGSGVAEGPG